MPEDIQASITGHRIRKKFGKTFTEYNINVIGLGKLAWVVHRRFNDFAAMHYQLSEHGKVDTKLLPKLPSATYMGHLKADFIRQRQTLLDKYLKELTTVPGVATSMPLLMFMGALEGGSKEEDKGSKRLYLGKLMTLIQAGDLLLMKTDGVLQAITRSVIQSKFDHIGVVVPSPESYGPGTEWSILEATSDGVRRYGLRRRLLAWNMSKAKVVWRRLYMQRTTESQKCMEDFTKEVDGMPYALNPIKLLRRRSVAEKETYFCSELVASSYKRLGVLPDEAACSGYLPSHFDEEHGLELLQGAHLGDEIVVEFQLPGVRDAERLPESETPNFTASSQHHIHVTPALAHTDTVSKSTVLGEKEIKAMASHLESFNVSSARRWQKTRSASHDDHQV